MNHLRAASKLLVPKRDATTQAKNFGAYCAAHQVKSMGQLKVAKGPTSGCRGLVARKAIPQGGTVVAVPRAAWLSVVDAVKDHGFLARAAIDTQGNFPIPRDNIGARTLGGFVQHHHVLLGLYMCDILLQDDVDANNGRLKFVDFMPRYDGDFSQLITQMAPLVEATPLTEPISAMLARHYKLERDALFGLLMWCLCMLFSRSVPMAHPPVVAALTRHTPFAALGELPAPASQQEAQERAKAGLAGLPVLVPMVDLVNHARDASGVNVELAVPTAPVGGVGEGDVLVLQATKPIAVDEELLMQYAGGDANYARIFYGVP